MKRNDRIVNGTIKHVGPALGLIYLDNGEILTLTKDELEAL